jgi:glycosyltransferase involved in cell wall biosynthesis
MSSSNGHSELRVLVLAEHCNPEWVSGSAVGWFHALALSKRAKVHLVTHGLNRENIQRAGWPADQVTFIDLGRYEELKQWVAKEVFKTDYTTQMFTLIGIPFYWLFEQMAWQQLGPRIKAGEFDVVHRITPVSPVVSSPIARRCAKAGVPFILGPINGGLPWPKGYENALHKEREFVSRVRGMYKYAPYLPSTWRSSAAILCASSTTWHEIPDKHRSKTFYMTENGIAANRVTATSRELPAPPLRAVVFGRLVALKCVDVALRGAAELARAGKLVIDIIGDGPERSYLEGIAREEGIAEQTTFHGWIHQQRDAQELLGKGHVLLFPSIRDFGGGAVVEAMALGLVPIVMAYGGPSEIVDETSGYRLPLESSQATARKIADILQRLQANPDKWRALSDGSRRRVSEQFTWESKAQMSTSVYEALLGRAPRPELVPPLVTPDS